MKILLAVDGSKHSKETTVQCGKLAANFETAKVKIVTVLDNFMPTSVENLVNTHEFLPKIEAQLREHVENTILNAKRHLRSENQNLDIETEILEGSAKHLIVEAAEKWNADLIVIGSHGYGFWKRNFLGSVSDTVVHHAPCSVVVVKRSA